MIAFGTALLHIYHEIHHMTAHILCVLLLFRFSLYEQVRSDRNVYSKNLIEAQDEIAEMKRKLKIMNHQIDQLKV